MIERNLDVKKGFIWTAYGLVQGNIAALNGYKQLFAFNKKDAETRFRKEYGHDSAIIQLIPDTFSQWNDYK